MRMIIKVFKLHNHQSWINIVVEILLFTFIALMYLHGKHYPTCLCIFPDEILDLQYCISVRTEDIRTRCEEHKDKIEFTDTIEIEGSSLFYNNTERNHIPLENPIITSFEKRLFLLQHYNS